MISDQRRAPTPGFPGLLQLVAGLAFVGAAAAEPAALEAGGHEFQRFCASCHGPGGRGDGFLADKLTRRPSDLTLLAADNGGSFPETLVYQAIDGRRMEPFHGTRDMPIWGRVFRLDDRDEAAIDRRISRLVGFLESLQRRQPAD
ncbi:MAG: c-type cytochrome [Gammaproteobacteria bacterium]